MYRQLPKVYKPQEVETKWYDYWLKRVFSMLKWERERNLFAS